MSMIVRAKLTEFLYVEEAKPLWMEAEAYIKRRGSSDVIVCRSRLAELRDLREPSGQCFLSAAFTFVTAPCLTKTSF